MKLLKEAIKCPYIADCIVYHPIFTIGTKRVAILDPLCPNEYLVISAKDNPVFEAIIQIAIDKILKNIFPARVAVTISFKDNPFANPPPAIIEVTKNTNPVQTIVILKKLFLLSCGTACVSKSEFSFSIICIFSLFITFLLILLFFKLYFLLLKLCYL